MKKVYFIVPLLVLFIISCEKDYTGIIDSSINEYQILTVSPSGNITFNAIDSLITIKITFTPLSKLSEVSFDIYSSQNKKLNDTRLKLFDDGNLSISGDDLKNDNKFANKFPLSSTYPVGDYKIYYYVTNLSGETKQAAQSNFVYDNGQDNIPPVISNVVIDPDTVVVNAPTVILCSVQVDDENGLSDIDLVYFVVYRPDGTTSGFQTQLFDDGNTTQNGDLTAGDGIYSRLIQVDQNNQKGLYRFEFRARDRGGLFSNIINKNVLIQ